MEGLTTDEALVYNAIKSHIGEENSITRDKLSHLTFLSDRAIRRTIQALRKKGYMIASTSKHSGYYIPKTNQELNKMLKETQSRIKQLTILEKNITMWIYGQKG